MDQKLNIRFKIPKLLEENMRETVQVIGIGYGLLDWTSKAQETKARNDKQAHIQLKSFCTAKEIINGVKRQPSEWKKIFASYPSDRGLISRIYEELKEKL
jgi:hypothetical protein